MPKKKTRSRGNYEARKNIGWYCMYRGWQDHPIFGNDPFTKREAWEWMIAAAVYSNEGILIEIKGRECLLMRGQLSYSLTFLAKAWGWDDSMVDRFIKKLQRNGMIEIESEVGQNIITICNYEEYQKPYESTERTNEGSSRQQRDKSESNNKKEKKGNKKDKLRGSASRANRHASPPTKQPADPFHRELKLRMGKACYKSWGSNLELGNNEIVYAPNKFMRDWCNSHYEEVVKQSLEAIGLPFNGIQTLEDAKFTPAKSGGYKQSEIL